MDRIDRILKKSEALGIKTTSANKYEKIEEIAIQLGLDPNIELEQLEDILDEELLLDEEFFEEEEVESLEDEEVIEEEDFSDEEETTEETSSDEQTTESNNNSENQEKPKDETSSNEEESESKSGTSDESNQEKPSEKQIEENKSSDEKNKSDQDANKQEQNPSDNKYKKDEKDIGSNHAEHPDSQQQKNKFKNAKPNETTSNPDLKTKRTRGNSLPQKSNIEPAKELAKDTAKKTADTAKKAGKTIKQGAKKAGKTVKQGAKKAAQVAKKTAQTIISFIKSNPYVLIAVVIIFVIFFVAIMFMDDDDSKSKKNNATGYYDPGCNFNEATVSLTTCNNNADTLSLSLKDYTIGMTYSYIKDGDYSDSKIQAIMVIVKTNALSNGNYSRSNQKVTIDDCNKSYTPISSIGSSLQNLESNYEQIEEEIFINSSYTGTIESLTSADALNLDDETLNQINNESGTYTTILNSLYGTEKSIYKISDNCTFYVVTENDAYWWPIGSKEETSDNIYGGVPVTTNVSSPYGYRTHPITGEWKKHYGIDISDGKDNCGEVLIATKSGKISDIGSGCTVGNYECGYGYGNYVEITHDDGIKSLYAHMSSIDVTLGQKVAQGQKIGLVGTTGSSTGCHLHFEIWLNGTRVDPLDYVSADNPRGISRYDIIHVNDSASGYSATKKEVCHGLLNAGFSENAVAGMLVNIQSEGAFQTNNLEGCYEENQCCYDGTYGFCQHPEITGFGTDEKYTAGVDDGTYSRDKFINDRAGYGLIQWTSSGRKAGLYDYAKQEGKSIAALSVQVNYLLQELKKDEYAITYKYITGNYTAEEIAENFCLDFESPADEATTCENRTNTYTSNMLTYVQNGCSN